MTEGKAAAILLAFATGTLWVAVHIAGSFLYGFAAWLIWINAIFLAMYIRAEREDEDA